MILVVVVIAVPHHVRSVRIGDNVVWPHAARPPHDHSTHHSTHPPRAPTSHSSLECSWHVPLASTCIYVQPPCMCHTPAAAWESKRETHPNMIIQISETCQCFEHQSDWYTGRYPECPGTRSEHEIKKHKKAFQRAWRSSVSWDARETTKSTKVTPNGAPAFVWLRGVSKSSPVRTRGIIAIPSCTCRSLQKLKISAVGTP